MNLDEPPAYPVIESFFPTLNHQYSCSLDSNMWTHSKSGNSSTAQNHWYLQHAGSYSISIFSLVPTAISSSRLRQNHIVFCNVVNLRNTPI